MKYIRNQVLRRVHCGSSLHTLAQGHQVVEIVDSNCKQLLLQYSQREDINLKSRYSFQNVGFGSDLNRFKVKKFIRTKLGCIKSALSGPDLSGGSEIIFFKVQIRSPTIERLSNTSRMYLARAC